MFVPRLTIADGVVERPALEPLAPFDRRRDDLDPAGEQRLCIALRLPVVGGRERDPRVGPELDQLVQHLRHARVARAAVVVGNPVVDDEDPVGDLRVAGGDEPRRVRR